MKQFIASLLIALMATTAFADVASERDKTKKGAVIGGVAGAIAGAIIHNNRGSGNAKRGAVIGGVVGAATGAIVGAMMDKQERELRQIEGIDVARTDEDELKVTMRNEILFDFNSASLRSARVTSCARWPTCSTVTTTPPSSWPGHTDSTGSDVVQPAPLEPPRQHRLRTISRTSASAARAWMRSATASRVRRRRTRPPAAASRTAASRSTSGPTPKPAMRYQC